MNASAFLLDTQAFLWWKTSDARLSPLARKTIEENTGSIALSAASCWEIAVKFELGKLSIPRRLAEDVERGATESGLTTLPISFAHCQLSARLPSHHKDPFDRILIAQASIESMTLIGNDTIFDRYGALQLW